jgi:4-alpha-glucanotransferase
VDADGAPAAAAAQARERERLRRLLEDQGLLAPGERDLEAIVAALHGLLARSPAMLVAATLEDAVGARERPNVPGTTGERPNWSLALPVPLDDLAADPRVRRLAAILSNGVKASRSEAERKS